MKDTYSTAAGPKPLRERLEDLAADLRTNNPDREFYVDDNGVWLRTPEKDYGVYATTILDGGPIVQAMDFATGSTVLHRERKPSPA